MSVFQSEGGFVKSTKTFLKYGTPPCILSLGWEFYMCMNWVHVAIFHF